MKKIIKIIYITGKYILIIFLLFLVSVLVLSVFPIKNNFQILKVLSGSMEPKIRVGSVVIVRPIQLDKIKKGDIINFNTVNTDTSITHRVVNVTEKDGKKYFQTKGDANENPDIDLINGSSVNGIVIFSLPFFGYLSSFIQKPIGYYLLIIFPAILIILSELINIKKAIEESVLKKYGIKKETKITTNLKAILMVFIPSLILINSLNLDSTYSYFASTIVVENNVFSMGNWVVPQTKITTEEFTFNTKNIHLDYEINNTSDLDFVQLCFSYNSQAFRCPDQPDFKSINGYFNFYAANDGLYDFYTIAHTISGNEENSENLDNRVYEVIIDTTPPTTGISLENIPINRWSGQNLVVNGSFEDGQSKWISNGFGEHHIVSDGVGVGETILPIDGDNMFMLGFQNNQIYQDNTDGVFQVISLPQNITSNLYFNYRLVSQDVADHDQFIVQIRRMDDYVYENLLLAGNTNLTNNYDSGWLSFGHSLIAYANQTIKLWFGVQESDFENNRTSVYIDNIEITTSDSRIGETITITPNPNDILSGIYETTPEIQLETGENNLAIGSTDVAQNSENIDNIQIIVLPKIVLNKISIADNIAEVEIYNNSDGPVNLENWYLRNIIGETVPFNSEIILGTSSSSIRVDQEFVRASLINNQAIYLFGPNMGAPGDSKYYNISENESNLALLRSPDGLGSWIQNAPGLSFNATYRPDSHKILLTVFNIPINTEKIEYEIKYLSGVVEKGISGIVKANTEPVIYRELYLGSCSSGGHCSPDSLLGSSYTIKISDKNGFEIEKTFNF